MGTPSRQCPICGRPAEERWRPFCSRGCADLDLLRWLNERYRIPAESGPSDEDETQGSGEGPSSSAAEIPRWTKGH